MGIVIRVFLIAIVYVILSASFTVLFNYLEERDTTRAGYGAVITTLLATLLARLLDF